MNIQKHQNVRFDFSWVQCNATSFCLTSGRTYINKSRVTYADGTATNGVIHVIDRLLFPKDGENFCGDDYHGNDDSMLEEDDVVFNPFFTN